VNWLTAIPIIGDLIGKWQDGKAAKESNRHAQEMGTLNQFAAEFGHGRTWFDSLVDGINRLPRPVIVSMLIYYLWLSWGDPVYFAKVNTGLGTIPEAMWYIIGIVITFFFGARELQHTRKANGFKAAADAALSLIPAAENYTDTEWFADTFPSVQVKDGVNLEGINRAALAPLVSAMLEVCRAEGSACVVTSAKDGKHKTGSKHYDGEALDFRIWHFDDASRAAEKLQTRLGKDYDVVLEKTHIHAEYDPKTNNPSNPVERFYG